MLFNVICGVRPTGCHGAQEWQEYAEVYKQVEQNGHATQASAALDKEYKEFLVAQSQQANAKNFVDQSHRILGSAEADLATLESKARVDHELY